MSGDPTIRVLFLGQAWFEGPPKTDTTRQLGKIGFTILGRSNSRCS